MKTRMSFALLLLLSSSLVRAQWVQTNGPVELTTATIKSLANHQGSLFVGTLARVFKTTDNGTSWTSISSNLPADGDVFCFAFSGTNCFAGIGSNGVYQLSDTGGSWTSVNIGLPTGYEGGTTGVPAIIVIADEAGGTHLLAGTKDGVYSSTDLGTSWTASNIGMPPYPPNVTSFAIIDTNLFAGTTTGEVYLSKDGGATWSAASSALPSTPAWVTALISAGMDLFAGTYTTMYRSSNSGTTWTQVLNGPLANAQVLSLAVSGCAMFVGTYWYGVYLSTDRGSTWTPVNTGLPANTPVFSLAVSGTELFAGPRDHGVWRRPLSEMVPNPRWELVFPPNGSTLASARFTFRWHPYFGASRYHVQSSKDSLFRGGFLLNDSTTTIDTTRLAYNDVVDSTWINPTEGRWYWRLRAYTAEGWTDWSPAWSYVYALTAVNESNIGPMNFRLEQNYPNPFNPSTTIRYSLPHRSHVTLTVFNTLGQHVATLVNGEIDAGFHSVQVDGSGLASGVYFYRLQANGFVMSRKLMLVK